MKISKLIAAPIATAALLAAPSVNAEGDDDLTAGEVKLAKMLEGRVAGKPQSCISVSRNYDVKIIDETALIYKSGSTLYVNIPRYAKSLDDDDILVRRTSIGTRVCHTDMINTVDRGSGFYSGNIFLGKFVPYRKEG